MCVCLIRVCNVVQATVCDGSFVSDSISLCLKLRLLVSTCGVKIGSNFKKIIVEVLTFEVSVNEFKADEK
jgi:hypothetical protein